MRCRTIVTLLLSLAFVGVTNARGQEIGPTAGTWGGEAGLGFGSGVSLLRFRSASSAWLLGVSAQYRSEDEDAPTASPFEEDFLAAQVRLGIRKYRDLESRARPFSSLSGVVGYQDVNNPAWQFGFAGDLGAAYFFTRHVSLGAALELLAMYSRFERDDFLTGSTIRVRTISAATGLRFLGGVYF